MKSKLVPHTIKSLQSLIAVTKHAHAATPNDFQRQQLLNMEKQLEILTAEKNALADTFLQTNCSEEWLIAILKQYPMTKVEGMHRVKSSACDWSEEKFWEFSELYEAVEKIQQLVKWMFENRQRGFGDFEKDIQRLAA